ncbi:hypothetical protein PEC18_09155 [Paucibacter sp. O1-1]|nr:hypothetical protein [Paucibacter sp. O1-1]MDA3826019.1 hypothetical protein [Paucibacter sp. O1-1]
MKKKRESDGTITDLGTYYRPMDRPGSPLGMLDKNGDYRQPATDVNQSTASALAFDAFGQARDWAFAMRPANGPKPSGQTNLTTTHLGFTGHQHLGDVGLIHMNGRAYDYRFGKFMSVDPFIQFPENSQSLNPYSYILNNPLSGTDPTGYAARRGPFANVEKGCAARRMAQTAIQLGRSIKWVGRLSSPKTCHAECAYS